MNKPRLIKRCNNQHNSVSFKENNDIADCYMCGECVRAFEQKVKEYNAWAIKNNKPQIGYEYR